MCISINMYNHDDNDKYNNSMYAYTYTYAYPYAYTYADVQRIQLRAGVNAYEIACMRTCILTHSHTRTCIQRKQHEDKQRRKKAVGAQSSGCGRRRAWQFQSAGLAYHSVAGQITESYIIAWLTVLCLSVSMACEVI